MGKIQGLYFPKGKTLTDIQNVLTEKLGDKYTYTYTKAGSNMLSKALTGKQRDTLLVAKNAYHRTIISLLEAGDKQVLHFDEVTLSGWLQFLYSNIGFIGSFIIDLIYGNGEEFYAEIDSAVKENFECEAYEVDTSLKAGLKNLKNAFK